MNQTKQEIREQGENFDRVKTQLRRDVISHYGEEKSLTVWNQIDHLKPIYILDHFPGLKATLSPERIKELQEISDVRTAKDVATIKKELPTRQYNFYRDPSHGWLSVTRQELIDLHIDRIVSKHSYQKGNIVYLEEDGDANLFLNKVISQAKFNLELIDKHSDKDSIIRTYEPYTPDPELEIAKCQDCKHEFFARPEELEGYVCPPCFIARENKRIDLLKKDTAPTPEMKAKIQHRNEQIINDHQLLNITATHRDTGQTITGKIMTARQAFKDKCRDFANLDPDELIVEEQIGDHFSYFKLELLHAIYCKSLTRHTPEPKPMHEEQGSCSSPCGL